MIGDGKPHKIIFHWTIISICFDFSLNLVAATSYGERDTQQFTDGDQPIIDLNQDQIPEESKSDVESEINFENAQEINNSEEITITKLDSEGYGFGLVFEEYPRVKTISPNSPASRSNLKLGDFIRIVNGLTVKNVAPNDVLQLIKEHPDTVTFLVEHVDMICCASSNSSDSELSDSLASLPPLLEKPVQPQVNSDFANLKWIDLLKADKGLGFSIMESENYVTVRGITANGVAEADGRLTEGNKIVMVNDKRFDLLEMELIDCVSALKALEPGIVRLGILQENAGDSEISDDQVTMIEKAKEGVSDDKAVKKEIQQEKHQQNPEVRVSGQDTVKSKVDGNISEEESRSNSSWESDTVTDSFFGKPGNEEKLIENLNNNESISGGSWSDTQSDRTEIAEKAETVSNASNATLEDQNEMTTDSLHDVKKMKEVPISFLSSSESGDENSEDILIPKIVEIAATATVASERPSEKRERENLESKMVITEPAIESPEREKIKPPTNSNPVKNNENPVNATREFKRIFEPESDFGQENDFVNSPSVKADEQVNAENKIYTPDLILQSKNGQQNSPALLENFPEVDYPSNKVEFVDGETRKVFSEGPEMNQSPINDLIKIDSEIQPDNAEVRSEKSESSETETQASQTERNCEVHTEAFPDKLVYPTLKRQDSRDHSQQTNDVLIELEVTKSVQKSDQLFSPLKMSANGSEKSESRNEPQVDNLFSFLFLHVTMTKNDLICTFNEHQLHP